MLKSEHNEQNESTPYNLNGSINGNSFVTFQCIILCGLFAFIIIYYSKNVIGFAFNVHPFNPA